MFEWSAEQQSEWLPLLYSQKMNSSSFLCCVPMRPGAEVARSHPEPSQSNLVRDSVVVFTPVPLGQNQSSSGA